jgi:hypothetical protein
MRSVRLFLLVALSACSLSGPLAPDDRRDLDRARDRWASKALKEYTFETRIFCFCEPAISAWTEVRVRNDTVIAATPLAALPFTPAAITAWRTVPELFQAIELSAASNFTRNLHVTFDDEYGYPRLIDQQCHNNITDCGVTYEARNLKPIR